MPTEIFQALCGVFLRALFLYCVFYFLKVVCMRGKKKGERQNLNRAENCNHKAKLYFNYSVEI